MLKITTLALSALLILSPAMGETPVANDHATKAQMRERLAACGTEWRLMKQSGTEGQLIWREFSASCMARMENGPSQGATAKSK